MTEHKLTGFGFGPIQAGLFVNEAYKSGNFERIVVAEIDPEIVKAVRDNNGTVYVNVASSDSIKQQKIEGIEIYNPTVEADRRQLLKALSESTEICTSLPSVNFYDAGENSVASLIREGLEKSIAPATIIYTAENNNHAAEILKEKIGEFENLRFLNTVIGKMSQVVTDPQQIEEKKLKPMAPGIQRAFLVEEFNKIMVTKADINGFSPGIQVFAQKEDLLPFEEAKLYGHNAIHFMLACLGDYKGYTRMAELKKDRKIMQTARKAFLEESGQALIKKYSHLNEQLFTEAGYRDYADDLLERMTNPYLDDPVERIARDPVRKLGLDDRIFGTMQLALEQGIDPRNFALGALAGLSYILKKSDQLQLPAELKFDSTDKMSEADIREILKWLWKDDYNQADGKMVELVIQACSRKNIY
jgi:mannitol-1-phosphate 5-dehydrogenase